MTPPLSVLQNKGFRVALVTDGRMSGASGAVPAAIHVTPGAEQMGPLARIETGDIIVVDAESGRLEHKVDPQILMLRQPAKATERPEPGFGLELFAPFRALVGDAEKGGAIFSSHAGAAQ